MDKKVLFNEALTSLVEFASANGNVITTEDVKVHFNNIIEDDSQYQFIYEYLATNKITISDYNVKAMIADSVAKDTLESEEELSFIKMYLSELDAIPPVSSEELSALLVKHVDGDTTVTNRLIESQLSLVATLAENYRGKGVTIGDLIQEGNMALMMAISEYKDLNIDFTQHITVAINKALDSVVNIEISSDRVGDRLAKKLNQLDDVTRDLNEKLGRVPSVEEIAEAMNIDKEEAEMLLKTSLDTLSVNEDTGIEDEIAENNDTNVDFFAPKEDPLNWRINKK